MLPRVFAALSHRKMLVGQNTGRATVVNGATETELRRSKHHSPLWLILDEDAVEVPLHSKNEG